MKLDIFNATQEQITEKQFNIFIGISIGVKPLDKESAKEYIEWAIKRTKKDVIVLIADYIAKINYEVFSGYNEAKSLRRALKEGDEYEEFFRGVLSELPGETQDRVKVLRWSDIFNDELKRDSEIIKDEFHSNQEFKEKILFFVREYAKRRNKNLGQGELEYLANYMFMELPTMFKGIKVNGAQYDLLFYPTFIESGMSQMVSGIAKGDIFEDLKKKMNLSESIVLVECYVDKS